MVQNIPVFHECLHDGSRHIFDCLLELNNHSIWGTICFNVTECELHVGTQVFKLLLKMQQIIRGSMHFLRFPEQAQINAIKAVYFVFCKSGADQELRIEFSLIFRVLLSFSETRRKCKEPVLSALQLSLIQRSFASPVLVAFLLGQSACPRKAVFETTKG